MTTDDTPRGRAVRAFAERFGAPPDFVARAPGRVNLIGEHTDYNDGFVFPVAIDRAVWIAGRARGDRTVVLHSLDFGDAAAVDLAAPEHREGHWGEYVAGMAWALAEGGVATPRGFDGVMAGNVPVGAGLSSSAALELAVARALSAAADGGAAWDPTRIARIAQRAENAWVGVNSGIMDQMISAAGRAGHALLIDCRSLETRAVPMGREAVVVLDTGTRRGLVDSAYNERRSQCEGAARHFGVRALRDVDLPTFERRAHELDDVTRRRARHVITENARTLAAADALAAGDAATAGRLMDESHASLRDDFEVSRRELDAIVTIARAQPGCLGARMTGAGFGGCAVALVAPEHAEAFARTVATEYERAVGIQPSVYVCTPSEGASVERQ